MDDKAKLETSHQTADELRLAEDTPPTFLSAVEQSTDLVVITDRDGVIEYVNPAFEKLTGYTKAETVGQTPGILKSDQHDQEFYKGLWQKLRAGEVVHTEFINKKKNGEFYHQSATITPIIDSSGVITHFVATGRDITHQLETELEELRVQARLRGQHEALIRLSTHPASAEGRLSEALALMIQVAAEALAVERVNIWRLSPDGRELRGLASFELTERGQTVGRLFWAETYPLFFAAIETVQCIEATDVSKDPRTTELTADYWGPLGITAAIEVPVRLHGQVIGVISYEHIGPPRKWAADEITFASQVADLVAQAFLHAKARSRAEELESTWDILRVLNATPAITIAFPAIAASLKSMTGCERASLSIFDDGNDWFTTVALDQAGDHPPDEPRRRPLAELAAADNILAGRHHRTPDLATAREFPVERSLYQAGFRSNLNVPLRIGKRVLGTLELAWRYKAGYNPAHLPLLDQVTDAIALAIERRRLFDETRRQARRVQQIMNTVPQGVLFLDEQRRVALANPAAEAYLSILTDTVGGNVLNHLGGTPLSSLLKPEPAERPFHEITMTGPPPRVFELVSRPLAEDITGGWVILLQDVTESRKIQEQIRDQERLAAVGQLAAGIAHDFNNLLTGIIGFAELLQMRMEIPEPGPHYLDQITKLGRQAANLIGQILDFSRKSVSQQLALDLVPFMKESIKFLERTIPENVRIVMEMTPGEFHIQADPTKIQQVITNLAVNARDAMPAGGELRVQLTDLALEPKDPPPCLDLPPGDWVVLSISDTGDGIPKNILPHIYEPFFTTKERGKGTGLGLAQVYGIIKQHRGYVDVKSRVGQGTTFTIYFPALLEIEPKTEAEIQLEIPRGHGETILLVEDEADVLAINQALLEELGYRLLISTNGKDALKSYLQYQDEVDLVLTDMVMPEMDGTALVEALKAHNPNVKVILITGYPFHDESGDLISEGIVSWVQKPVDLADLARAIARVLTR